jgi:hypothetical protein
MIMMKIFIGPSETILNCSGLDKTILILMNELHNNSLKPIYQELGEECGSLRLDLKPTM